MDNTEYYNQGFKLGEKCKDKRGQLDNLIRIATATAKDYEMIKNKVISICFANNEPIPDFLINLSDDNYISMTAYLTGVNNGAIHK